MQKQADAGIDIVSDGETSKISYATYIRHRLTGFEGDSARPTPQDLDDFPEYRDRLVKAGHSATYKRPGLQGSDQSERPEARRARHRPHEGSLGQSQGDRKGFMNSVSPGTIAVFQPNEYYPSHEAYLAALADAMREEYEMIVKSGLLLQLDCPDLAMGRHTRFKNLTDEEFLRNAEMQVEALNHALANVPADRVRLHVCWGNYEGSHVHDMDCHKIFPIAIKVKPQALLIEGANPRHEHEWEAWKTIKLPDDKVLVPGVIASSTTTWSILRSSRSGFCATPTSWDASASWPARTAASAPSPDSEPSSLPFCWMKLKAFSEGARRASEKLWGQAAA